MLVAMLVNCTYNVESVSGSVAGTFRVGFVSLEGAWRCKN